jgi:hypothetical protein
MESLVSMILSHILILHSGFLCFEVFYEIFCQRLKILLECLEHELNDEELGRKLLEFGIWLTLLAKAMKMPEG